MQAVPDFVTQAIRDFQPPAGFTIVPKLRGEPSLILDWGVRVKCMTDDKPYVGWICLGSRTCQRNAKIIQLFGNTSKATKHLADVHVRSSAKSDAEATRKCTRQQELDRVLDSIATTNDSRRKTPLIETLRIIRNNLPFRLGEYNETELLADLTVKPEFRATIDSQIVGRAIVELYASSKMRAIKLLVSNRITGVGSLAMVVDFLSCKTQPSVSIWYFEFSSSITNPNYI
ncbi:unnamed protein product [Phytophthora fragariaefolia]|uniref:Unnamed protein product n=1 Tax=Phytophthora fragariaefolia TaxID=1490495 RepID=A0A9W6XBX6_9STRA|nr:unnamed protein product [Phytophthora fragariaefolia]